jgi:hypothetical protein
MVPEVRSRLAGNKGLFHLAAAFAEALGAGFPLGNPRRGRSFYSHSIGFAAGIPLTLTFALPRGQSRRHDEHQRQDERQKRQDDSHQLSSFSVESWIRELLSWKLRLSRALIC